MFLECFQRKINLNAAQQHWVEMAEGFQPYSHRGRKLDLGMLGFRARHGKFRAFMPTEDIGVVSVTPETAMPRPPAKRNRRYLRMLLQSLGFSGDGDLVVGASARYIHQARDLLSPPRRVTQYFQTGVIQAGEVRYTHRNSGDLRIIEQPLWIDVCVGSFRDQPIVYARFSREEWAKVEINKDARVVRPNDVLFTLLEPTDFGIAKFHMDTGEPLVNPPSWGLSAAPMFGKGGDVQLLDTALDMGDVLASQLTDKPLLSELSFGAVAPVIMSALPRDIAESLSLLPEFVITEYTKKELMEHCGPTGQFFFYAKHTGTIKSIGRNSRQPHMMTIVYEANGQEIGQQPLPACAVLLEGIEVGSSVEAGETRLADPCIRMPYRNWDEFCRRVDVTNDGEPSQVGLAIGWLLPTFLRAVMTYPTELVEPPVAEPVEGEEPVATATDAIDFVWHGPGVLIDHRHLNPAIRGRFPVVWDFTAALQVLGGPHPEGQNVILPPFFFQHSDKKVVFNGVTVNLDARRVFTDRPPRGGGEQRPFNNNEERKPAPKQRNKRQRRDNRNDNSQRGSGGVTAVLPAKPVARVMENLGVQAANEAAARHQASTDDLELDDDMIRTDIGDEDGGPATVAAEGAIAPLSTLTAPVQAPAKPAAPVGPAQMIIDPEQLAMVITKVMLNLAKQAG